MAGSFVTGPRAQADSMTDTSTGKSSNVDKRADFFIPPHHNKRTAARHRTKVHAASRTELDVTAAAR
jgi:hypothetical protein